MVNLSKIIKYNKIAGVEANFTSDNEIVYRIVIVNIQKGKINPEPIKEEVRNLNELQKVIPNKIPICLTVTGKGIILKKYEKDDDNDLILTNILPFAKENEFYVDAYPQDKMDSWVAITRIEQMNGIIANFLEAGYTILDIFTGPFNVETIKTISDNKYSTYCTSSYQIDFAENNIKDIKKYQGKNNIYNISDENIDSNNLLALASAIKHLTFNQCKTTSDIYEVTCSANDFRINTAIKLFAKVGVAVLFILLMVNFLAYNNYNTKTNSINQEVFHNRSLLNKEKKLKNELTQKRKLLAETGLNTKSLLAYYADQLALSKPKNMEFEEMQINPVEVNSYKKNLLIKKNTIIISGNSKSSLQINNWVVKLSSLDFVESAQLFDLKYSGSKKITEFVLEITIKS
jgi:hypothetical protein